MARRNIVVCFRRSVDDGRLCLEFIASTADFSNGMPPALIVQTLFPRSIGLPRFGVRPAWWTIFLTLLRRLNTLRFGAKFEEDRDGRL
jgi:hypothetical protein